jgi:isoleucyl-tRNA synthetase
LCFTADEAWQVLVNDTEDSTLFHTHQALPNIENATELETRWMALRVLRDLANKEIEGLRSAEKIGSALQAVLHITADAPTHAHLSRLGDDAKFLFIVSAVHVQLGSSNRIQVSVAEGDKCERCWHYAPLGTAENHPTWRCNRLNHNNPCGQPFFLKIRKKGWPQGFYHNKSSIIQKRFILLQAAS